MFRTGPDTSTRAQYMSLLLLLVVMEMVVSPGISYCHYYPYYYWWWCVDRIRQLLGAMWHGSLETWVLPTTYDLQSAIISP